MLIIHGEYKSALSFSFSNRLSMNETDSKFSLSLNQFIFFIKIPALTKSLLLKLYITLDTLSLFVRFYVVLRKHPQAIDKNVPNKFELMNHTTLHFH